MGTTHQKANEKQTSATYLTTEADMTDLQIQAVTEILNQTVATVTALFIKTKNYHWHLSGPHFYDYHLLFDAQAEELYATIDIVAERVRRIGGTTIRSVGHISQLQRIEDDNEADVDSLEMVRRLLLDTKILAQLLREAHTISSECHDIATTSVLENLLDETEKRRWFLAELAKS